MARAKSVVLSKEEKKNLIAGVKASIKETKLCLKNIDSNVKTAQKAHDLGLKQAGKDRAVSAKSLLNLEAQLESLQAA